MDSEDDHNTADSNDGNSSDIEDQEVSLIEYARFHGLTKDYTSLRPLPPRIQPCPYWKNVNLNINPASELRFPDQVDLDEKWTIDHQSALFLRQIFSVDAISPIETVRPQRISAEFKVEPPLLSTDPGLDQRRFMRARDLKRNKGLLSPLSEACWQDNDEPQLYWPSPELSAEMLQEVKQERIQLEKDDIIFLQQCISIVDNPEIKEISTPPRRKMKDEYDAARHTSPLLPCSSPFQPAIPDSPVSRMPFATSPVDPAPAELSRIQEKIELEDEFPLDGLSDISAFDMEASSVSYVDSPLKRKRPEDFKVEVPLSPASQSSSPLKRMKMVTFTNDLCTPMPEYANFVSLDQQVDEDEIYRSFFEDVIKPGAESAIFAVENEQFSQADSLLRAEVPDVNQKGSLPPWQVFGRKELGCTTELEAQRQLISMLKREAIRPREAWSCVGAVNRAISRWKPFDMCLNDLPGEEIECEYVENFDCEEPGDTTFGWKQDGLRILDVSEDENEEIEFADMSEKMETPDLAKDTQNSRAYKNFEAHKPPDSQQSQPSFFSLPTMVAESSSKTLRPCRSPRISHSLPENTFSVSNSLDRFMQIHTGKQAVTATKEAISQPKAASQNVTKVDENWNAPNTNGHEQEECTIPALPRLPSLPTAVPQRMFVLSSTMFVRRPLIKQIKGLNPLAEYIERDFTSARALRGGSSQTSEADEADMILAPGHGLMLTTLQKLLQKSLPGQVTRNVIRERVVQLARRYEHLIIMVHEDRTGNQQRPLDHRDASEVASLVNFCAAQSHDIQVLYVPGDESALATWIVATMVRYGLDDPDVRLLQDETSWELFLRKAGMDAFAAQVVLIKLKAPDPTPAYSDKRLYGLAGFVMMGISERIKNFGSLFGGEKILRKVSMAIDGPWSQAAVAGEFKR